MGHNVYQRIEYYPQEKNSVGGYRKKVMYLLKY